MLAIAYVHANDNIGMKYAFGEVGGFAFSAEDMAVVVANAGESKRGPFF